MKPFVSIFIVVGTLLFVVFVKMETRRLGYSVLKQTRQEKLLKDELRRLDLKFTKLTRPGRIEQLATRRLELKRAAHGQIVQLFATEAGEATAISRTQ